MDQTTMSRLIDWLEAARRILNTRWGSRTAYFGLVPLLVVVALLLPPFSAWERVAYGDFTTVGRQGGVVTCENGARLTVIPETLPHPIRLRMTDIPQDELKAGSRNTAAVEARLALPPNLRLLGPFYQIEAIGDVKPPIHLTIPIPPEVRRPALVDLFTWDGTEWRWTPSRLNGDSLSTTLEEMPEGVALVQQDPARVGVAAAIPPGTRLSDTALDALTVLNPTGYHVQDDGTVGGQINLGELWDDLAGLVVLPTISNVVEGVVRSDWVHNILINPALSQAHVTSLAELVMLEGYDGLDLDYQQVDFEVRGEFTGFVTELASRLHEQGKLLTLTVDAPTLLPDGQWNTGGYDWVALGQAVDALKLRIGPETPNEVTEEMLTFAVGRVNRSKIQLALSCASRDVVGDQMTPLSYAEAIGLAGGIVAYTNPRTFVPRDFISLDVPRLRASGGIQWDEGSRNYRFTYQDEEGQAHTVWLEDAYSLGQKMTLASQFNLNGVALRDLAATGNDERLWASLIRFRLDHALPSQPSEFVVVWKVQGNRGQKLVEVKKPADNPRLVLTMEVPGNYNISAAISADNGRTLGGEAGSFSLSVYVPTATPTPEVTPTPEPTATPTPKPSPRLTEEPASTPATQEQMTPQPTSPPAPAAPPPARLSGGIGYGIQVDMLTDSNHARILDHVQGMGFNWIKQQVEWFRFEPSKGQIDWGPLDRIVDSANAYGIHVLFSVVKAPRWARPPNSDFSVEGPPANPQDFADFLGAMAARYKGRVRAYEVWNEQNLWYEWGHEPLDAGRYVQLLAAAYKSIKANDPNAIVVSGALTPTGVNDGVIGVDDALYLEQMYAAGLKNYCDAVGVHPSGYNNPPDARWETWTDPTAPAFKGHRSFFFRSTMEQYRNVMIKYGDAGKQLWPTEFGWATVENLGVAPAHGYEYAANNTEAEQAAWLVQAFQMARQWGWVGPMFVWNLNFGPVSGAANEKSAFGIVRPDWSLRPAYAGLRDMPK